MAELKTKQTKASVAAFLGTIKDEQTRKDCKAVATMMESATRSKGRMWGSAIVGFGSRKLKYSSGREIDWMQIGFSPRKQNITLYVMGFKGQEALLDRLGTHACGKGCLYIKRLSDVHLPTLKKIVKAAAKRTKYQM